MKLRWPQRRVPAAQPAPADDPREVWLQDAADTVAFRLAAGDVVAAALFIVRTVEGHLVVYSVYPDQHDPYVSYLTGDRDRYEEALAAVEREFTTVTTGDEL